MHSFLLVRRCKSESAQVPSLSMAAHRYEGAFFPLVENGGGSLLGEGSDRDGPLVGEKRDKDGPRESLRAERAPKGNHTSSLSLVATPVVWTPRVFLHAKNTPYKSPRKLAKVPVAFIVSVPRLERAQVQI